MSTYTIPLSNPVGTGIFVDTDSSNAAVVVLGAPGTVYTIEVDNTRNTVPVYAKLFNVAAASVVVGTTAPNVQIECLAGEIEPYTYGADGVGFSTAVSLLTTTDAGTAGTTAPEFNVQVKVHV